MATIVYNGVTLTNPLGKVSFSDGERSLTFSADFAVTPATLDATVTSLSAWDKAFSITSGGWTKSFALNTGSVTNAMTAARTTVEKLGDALDSSGLKRLRFSVEIFRQSRDSAGFREYTVTGEITPQDNQIVTISGEVTAQGTTLAKAVFDAGITAIESFWMTGGSAIFPATYEKVETTFQEIDRYAGRFRFNRVYTELFIAQNVIDEGAPNNGRDPQIIFPRWSITRNKTFRRGRDGDSPVVAYNVRWSAQFAKAKSESGVITQFEDKVRVFVHDKLATIFGVSADSLIFESDSIEYDRTQQTANANWVVSLAGTDTVSYVENVKINIKFLDSDKFTDGRDFTVQFKSPGARGRVEQSVTHVQRNSTPPLPAAPSVIISTEGETGLGLLETDQDYKQEFIDTDEEVTLVYRALFEIASAPAEISTGNTSVSSAAQTFVKGALQGGSELLGPIPEDLFESGSDNIAAGALAE